MAGGKKRLVVGVTGATGIAYAARLLEMLKGSGVESHLVVSRAADITRTQETGMSADELRGLADVNHAPGNIAAPLASGSFRTIGMVIIPCSMKTLAEVATGMGESLVSRAADVTLKERRRLVLVTRETPLNLIHLRNMTAATEAGAIIFPPVPALYSAPKTIDDMITQTAGRVLDLFDIEVSGLRRWGEEIPAPGRQD
ncbi:MAG: UbiX family flavin prenyltransferase [Planctomycetota bacterium]|nr:UbiX family flavin prenyltransferase [Planctomycetota bacterium]